MITFNVTYDIITEESAENGDVEESGFIGEGLSLRDAVEAVQDTRTSGVGGVECIEGDTNNPAACRWFTITNGMEFETGAVESRSLHMPDTLTGATRIRIGRLIGMRIPSSH